MENEGQSGLKGDKSTQDCHCTEPSNLKPQSNLDSQTSGRGLGVKIEVKIEVNIEEA